MSSGEQAGRRRAPGWVRSPLWFVAAATLAVLVAYPTVHDIALGVMVTPAERGYRVALCCGCFNCHGPDGAGGVKNPGSPDGEVPGFSGGTPMMWVKSEQELREYIIDGAPARKRADAKYRAQRDKQLLAMPAYGGYLSARDLDDLIVYVRAVSGLVVPPDATANKGQELAFRLGCFRCHGPMGIGGSRNPASLKGYIPGWWGSDFRDLVRDDEELRDWIRDGEVPRLRDNALAAFFLRRQRVYMPAYRGFISDADLEALVRYLRWVNQGDWQKQPLRLGQ